MASNSTRAQAFNEWFHGLKGPPPGPDVYEAFKAGWTARDAEVEQLKRIVAALKSMLEVSDPCIHVQMVEAVEAIKRGDTITLEELEARYPAFREERP